MKVIALRSFPYAHDGIHVRQVADGEEFDCQPSVIPGLKAEGYIAEVKAMGPSPENKMAPAAEENKVETEPETEVKPTRRRGRKAK